MRFLILRRLQHSDCGMFVEYRRQGKERGRQRSITMDAHVVNQVFPGFSDGQTIPILCRYLESEATVLQVQQYANRQDKNWRLEGNCPKGSFYSFIDPGVVFAMFVDASNTPASAAWVAIPPGHPCEAAILGSPESSDLGSASMVAIPETKAQTSLRALSEHYPLLFTPAANPQPTPVSKIMDTHLVPEPLGTIRIWSASGHTIFSAISDLVDNAIGAGAVHIRVHVPNPNDGGFRVAVIDDGRGMQEDGLRQAMVQGAQRQYAANEHGRYGYGLKGASFSLGTRLVVRTKTSETDELRHLMWDQALFEKNKNWALQREALTEWEKSVSALTGQGTAIMISGGSMPTESIKQYPDQSPYVSLLVALRQHLELTFHRFLEGKAAGRPTIAISLVNNEGETVLRPFNPCEHAETTRCDSKDIQVLCDDGKSTEVITVRGHVIPSRTRLEDLFKSTSDIRNDPKRWATPKGFGQAQGVYVYRSDRLISYGDWPNRKTDPHGTYARVTVDISRNLDKVLSVAVTKSQVQFPFAVLEAMRPALQAAYAAAEKIYRNEEKATKPAKAPKAAPSPPPNSPHPIATPQKPLPEFPPAGTASPPAALPQQGKVEAKAVLDLPLSAPWKIGTGYQGTTTVQVSRKTSPALAELAEAIAAGDKARSLAALERVLRLLERAKVTDAIVAAEQLDPTLK